MKEGSPIRVTDALQPVKSGVEFVVLPEKTEPICGFLSGREIEVLIEIAKGKTNRETANQLGISVKTLEKHSLAITTKLNVYRKEGLIDTFRQAALEIAKENPYFTLNDFQRKLFEISRNRTFNNEVQKPVSRINWLLAQEKSRLKAEHLAQRQEIKNQALQLFSEGQTWEEVAKTLGKSYWYIWKIRK